MAEYRRIDLNRASEDELAHIEGVGSQRAHQIIELRERKGTLHDYSELKEIQGFDDRLVEVVQRNTTLGGEPSER